MCAVAGQASGWGRLADVRCSFGIAFWSPGWNSSPATSVERTGPTPPGLPGRGFRAQNSSDNRSWLRVAARRAGSINWGHACGVTGVPRPSLGFEIDYDLGRRTRAQGHLTLPHSPRRLGLYDGDAPSQAIKEEWFAMAPNRLYQQLAPLGSRAPCIASKPLSRKQARDSDLARPRPLFWPDQRDAS